MKIWIQSGMRTGGTTLFSTLYNLFQPKHGVSEPFNNEGLDFKSKIHKKYTHLNFWKSQNEFVVKNTLLQYPQEYYDEFIYTSETAPFVRVNGNFTKTEYYENFLNMHREIKKFVDLPIILSRRNIKDAALSFAIAEHNKNFEYKYQYKSEYKNLLKNNHFQMIIFQNELLEKLSEIYERPIIYYEDVYSNNSEVRIQVLKKLKLYEKLESKQIDYYIQRTNPINRYRKYRNSKLI
jgi:hypothetical protein